MRLSFQRSYRSINQSPSNDELSDFIVLTGKNGSGKSTLLDAIEQGHIIVDGLPNQSPIIRIFRLSQLIAAGEGQLQGAAYQETWTQLANRIADLVETLTNSTPGLATGSPDLDEAIRSRLVDERRIKSTVLSRLEQDAGKSVSNLTVKDIRRCAPLLMGIRDPFSLSIGEVFLTYHSRKFQNDVHQYLKSKGDTDIEPLSDAEFIDRFGAPPWEEMNRTLQTVGLPYIFTAPVGTEGSLNYQARLTSVDNPNVSVSVDELSSGERTLLALTMSLFTGSTLAEAIELPKILLLDEADASLHPSMIASMLHVVRTIFVTKYGVRVILTTHSPTTVALAPENSLYIMSKAGNPRLKKASSRDEALKSLTVGLPTLSVKVEDRRQVFVESDIDEVSYDKLYTILKPRLTGVFSLQFIASGTGGSGNVQAVRDLVMKLRQSGNDSVFGLIDRDERQSAPANIYYDPSRNALENLILDPLGIGALLIREKMVANSTIGLPNDRSYFNLSSVDAQKLVDYVISCCRTTEDDTTPITLEYIDGIKLSAERWVLDMDGHDYLARLKQRIQPLNSYRSDKSLLENTIDKIYSEVPAYIPKSIYNILDSIAS